MLIGTRSLPVIHSLQMAAWQACTIARK